MATSRCNGILERTRHNRHNGLLPVPTCYGLVVYVADLLWTCYGEVADLLRTCYEETGVIDFGLYRSLSLHCLSLQTQTNIYEIVIEMNIRQLNVERRTDQIEEELRRMQVTQQVVLQLLLA